MVQIPIKPMLAQRIATPRGDVYGFPFTRDGYAYEVKWDGWRMVAVRTDATALVYSRPGQNMSDQFPEIAKATMGLPAGTVLDGEVVVIRGGKSAFQALQNHRSMSAADREASLRYVAFDVLQVDGEDVTKKPFTERKALLQTLITMLASPYVIFGAYTTDGRAAWALAEANDFEGIIAKPLNSPYRLGERGTWLKLKRSRVEDFSVVGYEEGEGRRAGTIGALVIAEPDTKGDLQVVGSVGTGFTDATLDALMARFRPLLVGKANVPRRYVAKVGNKHINWLREPVTARVEYADRSDAGVPRHPAFKGLVD